MPTTEPLATDVRIVLTTAGSLDEARRLGRAVVEARLAACATVIPAVESIYRWQGEIESATECLLLLKTGSSQLAALEARILALHSYDTPEFLALPIDSVSAGYLAWMRASLLQP